MEFFDYDLDEIYRAVAERAKAEGAYTRESWKSIVDAVLEDRVEFGEIHDEDIEEVREGLMNKFADFEDEHQK